MYMYMYMYMYVCMHACMHACMYVYMHVCLSHEVSFPKKKTLSLSIVSFSSPPTPHSHPPSSPPHSFSLTWSERVLPIKLGSEYKAVLTKP